MARGIHGGSGHTGREPYGGTFEPTGIRLPAELWAKLQRYAQDPNGFAHEFPLRPTTTGAALRAIVEDWLATRGY